ncbi:TPA: hypothetical protein NID63_001968 [Pseudomonas aeruginosa]|uniref:hypothetical protein n=1 Tax=Pseudomonas aeruginosa TaxID=287 RepID=UPI0003B98828|nr:hypothetical protein [Pseudomonas aeruginosa]ELC8885496.1 hypothetical protein [Pseudomonas aeruginosa]ELM5315631.1 hypothetical protein [Pseudomonas aeruginosa]ERY58738.1 hypothetical protein Q056_03517 [Pseudomonas aeruginosa BL02]MBH8736966.1 hypothetical protein [Pseudomonas aeruginosa]MBI6967387.1 hypothetical protein [Pseudomonas aeruginosa]
MTESKICTCPSGDGSLRWPCPKHPAVDQADVAAKLTFINGRPAMCGCQVEYSDGGGEYSDVIYVTLCAKHSGSAILDLVATNRIALTPEYEGQWHADLYLDREIPLAKVEGATPAEAVLALMSAERIDPEQESVEQAGGDERAALAHRSEFHQHLKECADEVATWPSYKREALTQPSPLQAEQAEAERPEGPTEDELEAAGLGYPLHKEEAVKLWYSGFRSEVITVLEAWEAIGHDTGINPDKEELLDSLRYMLEKCEAHDAALARAAELEKELAMTRDAASKGDAARHAAGGMEMEIQELKAKLAEQAQHSAPEVFGLERYRVERTGQGFWPYCVRAGDGTRELFVGHLKQCKRVAAQLATAFEDGKFIARLPTVQAQHSVPEISGIGRDAEHPRAVVLYLRNEPSDEDMRAIQNFLRAISADVLTQAQHSVPELLEWAVGRWHAEVSLRPLINVHRRALDDTWRQVIRRLGGDTGLLCGPSHDELLAAAPGKEVGHE